MVASFPWSARLCWSVPGPAVAQGVHSSVQRGRGCEGPSQGGSRPCLQEALLDCQRPLAHWGYPFPHPFLGRPPLLGLPPFPEAPSLRPHTFQSPLSPSPLEPPQAPSPGTWSQKSSAGPGLRGPLIIAWPGFWGEALPPLLASGSKQPACSL